MNDGKKSCDEEPQGIAAIHYEDEDVTSIDSSNYHAEFKSEPVEGEKSDESFADPFSDVETYSDDYIPSKNEETSSGDEEWFDAPEISIESTATETPQLSPTIDEPSVQRKRKGDPRFWKKNVRKLKKLRGEEYIGDDGKLRASRPLLPAPCKGKPKHNCCKAINEYNRMLIYKSFRKMISYEQQKQYIVHHVKKLNKKTTTRNLEDSRRSFTYRYSFTIFCSDRDFKVTVCREFFLATLNVSDSMVRNCVTKTQLGVVQRDNRGRHAPHNKFSAKTIQYIHNHIFSFPIVESHYCRSTSQKKYLDAQLSISFLYRDYKIKCAAEGYTPASLTRYRRAAFGEYNLGFFKPKKDQCRKCLIFNALSDDEKVPQKDNHAKHLERRSLARQSRDEDKAIAKTDPSVLAFNFDLQAVLNTPKGPCGQIFYLRKLAVYNLTVYNTGNVEGLCYLWDETQGKRGSVEISSCIYKYVMSQNNVSVVKMMSDGCGGQQKNKTFVAMCMTLCENHPTIKTIDHKFFETGHTEMECDSIHSKIEKKSKNVPVYVPEGWAQIIRGARNSPKPFEVHTQLYDDFFNYNYFAQGTIKLPLRNICWLRYIKDEPYKIFFKNNYSDEQFFVADVPKKKGRRSLIVPKPVYSEPLPIAEAKLKDLRKMCETLVIPKEYHTFYKNLKSNNEVRDALPEPNFSEESDCENDN